jgi:hypothetical protein
MVMRTTSALSVVRNPLRHRLLPILAAVLLLPGATPGLATQPTDHLSTSRTRHPTAARSPADGNSRLPKITIEAERERALRLHVDEFVTAVVVQPWDDALDRWGSPICPLVAGLPKNWGELVLERISKAAIDAHAPLDGKVCHPNLYVLATDYPDPLLKKLWARGGYQGMYRYSDVGIDTVKHFMQSPRAIRVWYNTRWGCNDGGSGVPASVAVIIGGFSLPGIQPPYCTSLDTRISNGSIHSIITSAIVVIDLRRMKKMTIRQLADYVALVSLADLQLDDDPGSTPSILQLFSHGAPPQGLTAWDRALLYSLYHTSVWSKLQLPELEITMVRRLTP